MEYAGITYGEAVPQSPLEQFSDDSCRVTRRLVCDWDKRADFAAVVVGYPALVKAGATTYISRRTPMPYTGVVRADGSPFLWAVAANRVQGQGIPKTTVSGENTRYTADGGDVLPTLQDLTCELAVEWRAPPYEVLEDSDVIASSGPLAGYPDDGAGLLTGGPIRYITRTWDPSYKSIIIPRGLYRLVDGSASGRPIREALNRPIPVSNPVYEHVCRPDLPTRAIMLSVGKTNDATFDGIYPAGTLMCLMPKIRPYMSALGIRQYSIRFTFSYMPNVNVSGTPMGWNSLFGKKNDGTLDFLQVSADGTVSGQPLIRSTDLTALFRPDQ